EVLGSGRLHSVADMMRLQNDNVSIPARSIVPLLRDVPVPGSGPGSLQKARATATDSWQEARTRLLNWNYSIDADSVTAGVYEMFQRRVSANVRNLMVPKEAQTFIGELSMKRVIDWLQAPDGWFGSDAVRGRDELLTRSLNEAIEELTKKL